MEVGVTGNRKRRTKTFEKHTDAENWMGSIINDQVEGTYVDPSKVIVEEFMLNWLENEKKPHIATTTYDNYKNRIKTYIIPHLGKIPIQKVEPFHISQFLGKMRMSGKVRGEGGLSENTLKKIYVLLNSAFKKAVKFKLTKYNPVQAIKSPQPEDYEAPAMNAEEIQKLLNTAKGDIFMSTFILFAVLTGMRKSEIMGLEWPEVYLKEKKVEVKKRLVVSQYTEKNTKHEKKTKRRASRRTIKIPDNLVFQLKKLKNYQEKVITNFSKNERSKKEYVFCRPDGHNYYPTTLTDKFNKLLDKADLNLEYNIHTLRHTFGTLNLKNGVEPKIIQEMMGHKNISTTMDIYSHVDHEMQQKAVEKLEKSIIG